MRVASNSDISSCDPSAAAVCSPWAASGSEGNVRPFYEVCNVLTVGLYVPRQKAVTSRCLHVDNGTIYEPLHS